MDRNPFIPVVLLAAGAVLAMALLFPLIKRGKDPYPKHIITAVLEGPGDLTLESITRAIKEVVCYSGSKNEAIVPVLKDLLSHSELEVRVVAARYLYILGDDSGSRTLRKIISRSKPVPTSLSSGPGNPHDLRMDAASLATQFRDTRAADAIMELYENTQAPALLHCLARLEAKKAGPIIMAALHNQPTWELMEDMGFLKCHDDEKFIADAVNNQKMNSATRLAAAWALTQIHDDPSSSKFIRDYVGDFLRHPQGDRETAGRAVKYLGTLQDEESIELLQKVAAGNEHDLVRIALINLILHHRSNAAGINMLTSHIYAGSMAMSFEMSHSLAAASKDPQLIKVINDPIWPQSPASGAWFQDRIGQARWSVWGWADGSLMTGPKEY